MLPDKIYLIDHRTTLVNAWKEVFINDEIFHPVEGDYFSVQTDCMVSPANSFGIMDGGLDRAIRDTLGYEMEGNLQREIIEQYHGELPVGSALIIETGHAKWPHLICAPTMRIPEDVSNSLNAYLAFRAILLAIRQFNASQSKAKINSMVCPGLATGVGNIDPRKCAAQMRVAYHFMYKPARTGSFKEIHEVHRKLHLAG